MAEHLPSASVAAAAGTPPTAPVEGTGAVDTATFRADTAAPQPTDNPMEEGSFFAQISNRLFGGGTGSATIKQMTIAASVPEEEEEDIEGHSATKLQAVYRGHASRKAQQSRKAAKSQNSRTSARTSSGEPVKGILKNADENPNPGSKGKNRKSVAASFIKAKNRASNFVKSSIDGLLDIADDAFGGGEPPRSTASSYGGSRASETSAYEAAGFTVQRQSKSKAS